MAVVKVEKNTYTVDSLYQWDKNQDLIIEGLSLESVPEIHFTNDLMGKVIVQQSTMDDAGIITVQIPNSMLQKSGPIKAYVCVYEGDTFKSVCMVSIPVKARPMPTDYTLTISDAEVYSFKEIENRVQNQVYEYVESVEMRLDQILGENGLIEPDTKVITLTVDDNWFKSSASTVEVSNNGLFAVINFNPLTLRYTDTYYSGAVIATLPENLKPMSKIVWSNTLAVCDPSGSQIAVNHKIELDENGVLKFIGDTWKNDTLTLSMVYPLKSIVYDIPEIEDARVGYYYKNYGSVGEALRGEVKKLRDGLGDHATALTQLTNRLDELEGLGS